MAFGWVVVVVGCCCGVVVGLRVGALGGIAVKWAKREGRQEQQPTRYSNTHPPKPKPAPDQLPTHAPRPQRHPCISSAASCTARPLAARAGQSASPPRPRRRSRSSAAGCGGPALAGAPGRRAARGGGCGRRCCWRLGGRPLLAPVLVGVLWSLVGGLS